MDLMKRFMAVLLMLLPVAVFSQEKPKTPKSDVTTQSATPAQKLLTGTLQPLPIEWNFAVCGPEEFSTFHAQIDKDGLRQTFLYAMNGPELVEAMGTGAMRYDFRQVTIRESGDVQFLLTHTYFNRATGKLTLDSEIDENLYSGHLLGTLVTLSAKASDNQQDNQDSSGTDYLLLYATPGTLDQLPSFSEPGLALCKLIRAQSDDDASKTLLDWADGKPLPVLPPTSKKNLPDLPPTKEQK
jgi:hypothetical protein